MAAECWLMVVDIIALLLFPLSGGISQQRITIYYARAYMYDVHDNITSERRRDIVL